MAVYVILTAMLFQRGSAESRDPDNPHRPADRWHPRGWPPIVAWIYQRSLGLTLALLFGASFVLHWWFSLVAANEEAARHGSQPGSLLEYLGDPQLWFESFQNWQSEFLVYRPSGRALYILAPPRFTGIEACECQQF